MTQAYLRSFVQQLNQEDRTKPLPLEANRFTKIQADGVYRALQLAIRVETRPLEITALLRAWQELRDLGFDTDLDPRE